MLNRDQIELIQREIDGANTPDESAAFRSLLEKDPEARALEADLRQVTALLGRVEERAPPPHLRRAILEALPPPARASPEAAAGWMTPRAIGRWTITQLRLVTERMEEAIMTRKTILLAGTALALAIVVAALVTDFPPGGGEAGTIGAGDSIAGVRQASRYRGRAMTQADVTLQNPEIQALFQNDQVLRLVQSDAFRQVMSNDVFHELMSGEAYHELMSSEVYFQLMNSEAYHELMNNEAYRQVLSNDVSRRIMNSEAYHELMNSEAYHELMSDEAFRRLQSQDAFRQASSSEAMRALRNSEAFLRLQNNEAFLRLQNNEAFRRLQNNEAFRRLQNSEAFRRVQNNEAFLRLQNSEAFRAISRSQQLSEAFMNEAMRAQH